MGRLHHLRQTIYRNIDDNNDYPTLEFVLLDYNSPDQMAAWVRDELKAHLAMGLVKYFRTDEPEYFHHAHAKNVSHKLATGDVVCNLDADNFTGRGFASYLGQVFTGERACFVGVDGSLYPSACGRIALRRSDFIHLRGYEERIQGWGYDDHNLVARSMNYGLKGLWLGQDQARFLEAIKHDDSERVRYMPEGYQNRMWGRSQERCKHWLELSIRLGAVKANPIRPWGRATVFNIDGERINF